MNLPNEIKKALANQGISQLLAFQAKTLNEYQTTSDNLLVAAGTGRGKTESILVPLITKLYQQNNPGTLKAIFVMPLVALANDQAERIEKFLGNMNITVFKYHGDVSSSKKKSFFKNPADVLITTPESLQSMLRRDKEFTRKLFSNVEDVVIDEIHYFLPSQRGHHLYNLLWLMDKNLAKFRIMSLSATIEVNDYVKSWFSSINSRPLTTIKDDHSNQKITKLVYYTADDATQIDHNLLLDKNRGLIAEKLVLDDIASSIKKNKGLIFFDDKRDLETKANKLREEYNCEIYTHHGSLSKEVREQNEGRIKSRPNASLCCTSTMELGIDIGDVGVVHFTNPCNSVASYLQRLGRSGRKSKISKAKMYAHSLEEVVINYVTRELGAENIVEESVQYVHSTSKLFHTILMITKETPIKDLKRFCQFVKRNIYYCDMADNDIIALVHNMIDEGFLCYYNNQIEIADQGEERLMSFEMLSFFDGNNDEVLVYDANNNLVGTVSSSLFKKQKDTKFSLNGQTWLPLSFEGNRVNVSSSSKFEEVAFPSKGKSSESNLVTNNIIKYLVENELNLEYCDKRTADSLITVRKHLIEDLQSAKFIRLDDKEKNVVNACPQLKIFLNRYGMMMLPNGTNLTDLQQYINKTEADIYENNSKVYDIKFSRFIERDLLQHEAKDNQFDFAGVRTALDF